MRIDLEHAADAYGPAKVLHLHQPQVGLEAVVVVDNVAAGPAVGGVRMTPGVGAEEVFRLARAMTLKNLAAGLPHGGGKAGIRADPTMPRPQKELLLRTFAQMIRDLTDYIPGPDMGTDEACMAWIHDEIGRSVGLPRIVGGIPLDEIGATGLGVAVATEVGLAELGIPLEGCRVAIQGFGAVGRHATRFLSERGARLVAVSDSRGAVRQAGGLDVSALLDHKASGESVGTFPGGESISAADLVMIDCDVWVPAAQADVLHEGNVEQLQAKLVVQGANIAATEAAEAWMHANGVLNLPDFIANAGGVICAAVEYRGGSQAQAERAIVEKISENIRAMLERARRGQLTPRIAAMELVLQRLGTAMGYRRLSGGGAQLARRDMEGRGG